MKKFEEEKQELEYGRMKVKKERRKIKERRRETEEGVVRKRSRRRLS
jgi:hypothetical protein